MSKRSGKRWWFPLAGVGLLLALVAGLLWASWSTPQEGPTPPPPQPSAAQGTEAATAPLFRDMTAASGVDFSYRNGEEADQYSILETLGGGVALLDYDGDGLLDLFVTGGGAFTGPDRQTITGRPCKLYKNLGGWKFKDVTAAAGLDRIAFYSHGAAVADYDNDGWPDLLVTGYGRLALFHNEGDGHGGRRFVEVTKQAGLGEASWSTSAAWGDLTGNGFADLYVCHYLDWSFADGKNPRCKGRGPERDVCGPEMFNALPSALYRNQGDGTFRDVSAAAGLLSGGKGLGVVLADLNGDGRPDLYVANDTSGNLLYLNRGQGKLEEKGLIAGVRLDDRGTADGSMGVDAADFDGSGRPSLFVTNFEGQNHALYLNLGRELFHFHSLAAGLSVLGQDLVGFGTGFVDVDNDGWEDLVFVNGHVFRRSRTLQGRQRQRPVLLHNEERQGRRFFVDVSGRGGPFFQTPALGRGLAVGDLDNDGWPDLVVSNSNGGVVLLRNEAAATGHHWLGVRLLGKGHRPVAGATLTLEVAGAQRTRFAKGGGSYLSAGDPRLLFGLGAARQAGTLRVRWPWGQTERWDGLQADAYWDIHEGDPQPQRR